MKILVAFYSRTGTTKKVGEAIAKEFNADIEEIYSVKNRKGALGYILSGREAMKRKPAEIKSIQKDPRQYDIVIIGTPIWGWNMSSLIRTYLKNNQFKKVAFFCTQGGSGDDKCFKEMEEICSKKPLAKLTLLTKEVAKGDYIEKVREFVQKIKKS